MILEANHIHFTYPEGDKALVDASFTITVPASASHCSA